MRIRGGLLFFLLFVAAANCISQTPATPEIGANPYKTYSGGAIDHIQMQNGSFYLSIPLIAYKQLGKLSLSFSILANGSQWQEVAWCDDTGDCDYSYGHPNPGPCSTNSDLGAGYSYWGAGGGSAQIVVDQDLSWQGCEFQTLLGSTYYDWSIYGIIDSSQAAHEMGFNQSNWSQMQATDGSGYMATMPCFTSAETVYTGDCPQPTIYEDTGVRHIFNPIPSGASYPAVTLTDPAGNTIIRSSYSGSTPNSNITDSVQRQIPDPGLLPMSNDVSHCKDIQIAGQSAQQSQTWTVPGYSAPFYFCYTNINVATNFFGSGPGAQNSYTAMDSNGNYYTINWDDANYTTQVLQSVILPNGTSWGFAYDSATSSGQEAYGDMTKIVLPSGGSLNYEYTTIPVCNNLPGSEAGTPYTRAVSKRIADPLTGSSVTRSYQYISPLARGQNSGPSFTIETDAAGNDTVHNFTVDYPNMAACGAEETSTKWFQGSSNLNTSGTVLKEEDTSFTYQLDPQSPFSTQGHINVVPQTRSTYLDGQLQESVTYGYDTLFTDVEPYDEQGSPSDSYAVASTTAPIRLQEPTSVADGIIKAVTTRYATTNSAYQVAGLLELPGTISKYDPNGNLVQQTVFGYDEPQCSPQGIYGNLTSTSRDYGIRSTQCFNTEAMVASVTDANGNTTSFMYDTLGVDISSVKRPTTNGIPHIQYFKQDPNTGLTNVISDENASSADDTAHITSFVYDGIGRLTTVNYPDGGKVTQCYTDEGQTPGVGTCTLGAPPFSVVAQRQLSTTVTLNSTAEYDGLGRPIEAEDQGGALVDRTYDAEGNVASISNPYYSSSGVNGVTSYLYDALGRKADECDPDNMPLNATACVPNNSYKTWSYQGNTSSFSDENRHVWTRTTDAHDRLVQIVEPGALTTGYFYDPLDDLLSVNQSGNGSSDSPRRRTFTYDALSRLSCASNPENSSASCPSSYTGSYTPGTTGYTYDGNGNVLTKVSPAVNGTSGSQTIGYSYDGLNRLCYKVVGGAAPSQSPNGCPSSIPTGVIEQYWYDFSALQNAVNTVGHLTDEKSYAGSTVVSERQPYRFDAMGRLWNESQCILGHCFWPAYTYDLAGNLTTSTDGVTPSPTSPPGTPLTFTSAYDNSGRLQTVTSNWDDGAAHPGTLFSEGNQQAPACPNSPSTPYAPFGGLMNATLGIGSNGYAFALNRTYDVRQRISCEIDKPKP